MFKELDVEIDRENTNTIDRPVQSRQSTEETMKELALQKEDSKMKKVIAQMTLMKQIQRKREENEKLELALRKLAERRKIIRVALMKQKEVAERKRSEAFRELERQKELMESRERLLSNIRKVEQSKERLTAPARERESVPQLSREKEVLGKADMLEAHKLLVDRSNQRILERIEEIKIAREKEAIVEQEILLKEQQLAIKLLRQMQLQRDYKMELEAVQEKARASPSLSQRLKKAKATILLNSDDKKQVMQWMDLEKNSAILHKTDKAIAQKLRDESFSRDEYYDGEYEEDYTDSYEYEDIDDILGLSDMENIINSDFSSILDVQASPSFLDLRVDDYDDDDDDDDRHHHQVPTPEPRVHTHVKRLPNGRVSTSVSIGIETARPRIERLTFSPGKTRPQSFSALMLG